MSESANTGVTSRGSFSSLPVEITREIFSCLTPGALPTDFKDREEYDCQRNGWKAPSDEDAAGRDALRNLCLVSKTFRGIAGPLLYRNVTISTEIEAFKLFFGLLMNDMGYHIKNFAFVLLDEAVGFYTDPATFDAYQMCLRNPDLRRKVEQLYPYLLSSAIDQDQIMSPHFLAHIVMLSVGLMPRGEDVILSLPRPNDTRFARIEGLALPDMSSQDTQPVGPWKSIRFQAHTTFSRGTRDAAFLLLPFAAQAIRIEIYDEHWHCQGIQQVIERGELQRTNVQQFEDINLHIGATDLSWLSTLLEASVKLRKLTLGLNHRGLAGPTPDLDVTLLPAMNRIESLTLYSMGHQGYSTPRIASLPAFSSLKHLAIDLPLLWGDAFTDLTNVPQISRMLPPSIQTLTLRERMYESGVMAAIFKVKDMAKPYDAWMAQSVAKLRDDCRLGGLPELKELHLNVYDSYKWTRRFEKESMATLCAGFKTAGVNLHWSWYHDPRLHTKKMYKNIKKMVNKPIKQAWNDNEFRPEDVCDCC